jgi:AcrR family transcriptional regulator
MVTHSSTSTKSPAPRDAAATRQRLLRAALELFTTQGYRGTTTPMLAQRARVAEGTIYRHFKGKLELYNEVYRATQVWAEELVKEIDAEKVHSSRDRLERVGARLVQSAHRDPAAVQMLLARPESGMLDAASELAADRFHAAIEQIIAEGKAAGNIRTGPADLWASVWLELVCFTLHRVARREWRPEQPQTGQTLEAAWAAIAAAPPNTGI